MSEERKRLIRLPEVKRLTGMSKSEIYRRVASKKFPAFISLGARLTVWDGDEVDMWIKDVIARNKE